MGDFAVAVEKRGVTCGAEKAAWAGCILPLPWPPRVLFRAMNSALVRVSCPGCGVVEVRADDITIRACVELVQNTYRFRCVRCDTFVIKDASQSTVLLLLRAGATVETWHVPEDLRERPDDPPIHIDDLIDFHFQLDTLPTADPRT